MPAYRNPDRVYRRRTSLFTTRFAGDAGLVNQIVTASSDIPSSPAADAFAPSYIMRDVDWGWLIRYMHSTGASLFFVVVYLHMFRGLIYGSYQKPRELVWVLGMVIFLTLMAEAFMGYVLPWGQMSYWGAQVIINLFGAIPTSARPHEVDPRDYLCRTRPQPLFSAAVIALPRVILLLVVLNLGALHEVGSNNPTASTSRVKAGHRHSEGGSSSSVLHGRQGPFRSASSSPGPPSSVLEPTSADCSWNTKRHRRRQPGHAGDINPCGTTLPY